MILLGLVVFFCSSPAQSNDEQAKKKMCDDVIKGTQYIFIGKPISSKCLRGKSGGIHTSILFEVQEVISGSLMNGTVEIIKDGGMIDDGGKREEVKVFDDIQIPDSTALYFCFDEENLTSYNSNISKSNPQPIRIRDIVGISNSDDKINGRGIGQYFTTRTEFYNRHYTD